jgi:large subunit ribosomal protein L11
MSNIKCYLKLQIISNKATPSSPQLAPILGQHHINIKKFCDELNQKIKNIKSNIPLAVVVTVYKDKTFSFIIKSPSNKFFFKKVMYNRTISLKAIYEIAKYKTQENNPSILKNLCKMLIGSAKSMGLIIIK